VGVAAQRSHAFEAGDAERAAKVEKALRGRAAPHFGQARAVSLSVRARWSKAWPHRVQAYS
jgi:hypothetical protein